MVNDAIADAASRHHDRFLGAGGLPLQAPDLAVKELERVAATLRFPAVDAGSSARAEGHFAVIERPAEPVVPVTDTGAPVTSRGP